MRVVRARAVEEDGAAAVLRVQEDMMYMYCGGVPEERVADAQAQGVAGARRMIKPILTEGPGSSLLAFDKKF